MKWNNKLKPVSDPMSEMEKYAKKMESGLVDFGNFNNLNIGKLNKAANNQARAMTKTLKSGGDYGKKRGFLSKLFGRK